MAAAGVCWCGELGFGHWQSAFSGSQLRSPTISLGELGKSLFFSGRQSPHPQNGNDKTQLWGLLSDPHGQRLWSCLESVNPRAQGRESGPQAD